MSAIHVEQVPPVTQLSDKRLTLEVCRCATSHLFSSDFFYFCSVAPLRALLTRVQQVGISGQVALVMEDVD